MLSTQRAGNLVTALFLSLRGFRLRRNGAPQKKCPSRCSGHLFCESLLQLAINMSENPNPRVTQIMNLSALSSPGDGPPLVTRMIESGEEPRRIFATLTEVALKLTEAQGAALFLPADRSSEDRTMIASSGSFIMEGTAPLEAGQVYHNFDVICLGAPIGCLSVLTSANIENATKHELQVLAHHASVTFERQKLSNTLQLFLDRLEVLNELNQLIASNVGLQRILKSLARESAFRFAADVSLAFLLNEEKSFLEPKGGYGCAPNLIPKQLELTRGILGQVMRVGGHLSVPNLAAQTNHGLEFLSQLEIKSVDACCLEVRGEPLGAILIGSKREGSLLPEDLTRFEEFSQAAAVAISNARTQERIQSYTERLEELVEQRTSDLAIQTQRAEEANRAKSRFLANMSHELRTPLTAIVGYSSVLADGVFGEVNDKQKDALNSVVRSSEHLKNLIDDVLNLARVESGKENPEPKRVPLRDLLQQCYKLMLQTAVGKGVKLDPVKLSDELLKVQLFCDGKHIHQIVINLLSNAVKYTPSGGHVEIQAALLGDKAKISIKDSGVGIPPHKMAKLFERFERGEDAYSKSQEGTGIGLHLTRHLVEINGGGIGVESEEGKGSTFWIAMPLADEQTPVVTQQEQSEIKARLDGLTTIVVDDNKDTCEVLKHILMAAGANVRTGNSVQEAKSLLAEQVPDIILTDLAMPGESGLVLIEHVRNLANDSAHLPIIVLSACAFESDREAALNSGASVFIPKPFKPTEVIKQVRQLTLSFAMRQSGEIVKKPTSGSLNK
ncbi:MAG: hypothetical protein DCC75_06995 [Proteobacteria bacterium]|nr:MAG: hypothetical protein DCC75_06995 [Pseudomonadota bacterium]